MIFYFFLLLTNSDNAPTLLGSILLYQFFFLVQENAGNTNVFCAPIDEIKILKTFQQKN